ncbi:tyrosine-type recombinase/integrase [Nonomuraea sp. NPDC050383]|uniref:tyrosine-type recombinase/integrase n=1 Tax=Nonomuraea sp. NPDC050383 TaxID=3364362 RepID=UPI00379531FA
MWRCPAAGTTPCGCGTWPPAPSSAAPSPAQSRHTLGTRMINEGAAQHVVQRLYGHKSAEMTTVYARLTDQTLRQAFDEWSSKRVNIHGHVVLHDPGDEAAWLKEPGEACGNQRLVEMNQRVEISLTRVIDTIEELEARS